MRGDDDGTGCASGASTDSRNMASPPISGGSNASLPMDVEDLMGSITTATILRVRSKLKPPLTRTAADGNVSNNADGPDRNHNRLACEPG